MLSQPAAQTEVPQSMNTELEQLHNRMIAMESLLITMLAQNPDQQLGLRCEMAGSISPRPGFTDHPGTLGAAALMVHFLRRARNLQRWVEGDTLS
jgi:hypothetical protein